MRPGVMMPTYTDDDTAVMTTIRLIQSTIRVRRTATWFVTRCVTPMRWAEVLEVHPERITCASAAETDCRVTNQNNHFRFVGPWVFTPSSATSTVRVEDSEFMYFGVWARQAILPHGRVRRVVVFSDIPRAGRDGARPETARPGKKCRN